MRGIKKPWPPQNVAPASQQPCTMQRAERDFLASLATTSEKVERARTRFDDLDKAKLRQVMYTEQHHVCVYCERRIEEGTDPPPIEHWIPLREDPERAMYWENLYLSCAQPGTCDDAKQGKRLAWAPADPSLPWPTQADYEHWLGFTRGGEAYVRTNANLSAQQRRALQLALDDQMQGGSRRPAVLALNHPALVEARKAAISSERSHLERMFPAQTATPAERTSRANQLLGAVEYPSFVSIRVAWLANTLGKGRP